MAKEFYVFSEKPGLMAELLANAVDLAGQQAATVSAIVVGDQSVIDKAFAQGAQKVYTLGAVAEGQILDDFFATIIALVKENNPPVVMIGATRQGKALAGRLSAALSVSTITDAKFFNTEADNIEITHLIFGGGAVRVEKANTQTMVMTQGASVCEALPAKAGATGEVVEVSFVEPAWKASLVERKPKPPSSVNLAVAKTVICAGRGIGKKEDLDMVFELATILNGEVAATRPLTEGLDWLPRERYIGVSGATVKPDLYLSVGVSGQAQHTVGITESRG